MPPKYKPSKGSTPASTSPAAVAKPAPAYVNTSPSSAIDPADNVHETFYEIYRALLVSMSERNMETRELVEANIEEFKKIATQSTIRTA